MRAITRTPWAVVALFGSGPTVLARLATEALAQTTLTDLTRRRTRLCAFGVGLPPQLEIRFMPWVAPTQGAVLRPKVEPDKRIIPNATVADVMTAWGAHRKPQQRKRK